MQCSVLRPIGESPAVHGISDLTPTANRAILNHLRGGIAKWLG